jgi:hypothetical protein
MENGRVAGVAFSKNIGSSMDNIGYVIPQKVVQHFLEEWEAHGKVNDVRRLSPPSAHTRTYTTLMHPHSTLCIALPCAAYNAGIYSCMCLSQHVYMQFRGVPSPGFSTQDLENPAQKAYLKASIRNSTLHWTQEEPLLVPGQHDCVRTTSSAAW